EVGGALDGGAVKQLVANREARRERGGLRDDRVVGDDLYPDVAGRHVVQDRGRGRVAVVEVPAEQQGDLVGRDADLDELDIESLFLEVPLVQGDEDAGLADEPDRGYPDRHRWR